MHILSLRSEKEHPPFLYPSLPLRRKMHLPLFSQVKVQLEGLQGLNKMRQASTSSKLKLRWACQKQLQDAANFCLTAVIKGSLCRFIGLLYLRSSIIAAIYTHYGIWQGFMLAYTPGWLIWQWCTRSAAVRSFKSCVSQRAWDSCIWWKRSWRVFGVLVLSPAWSGWM